MEENRKQKTLAYYKKNAESFTAGTQKIDFSKTQEMFLKYLPEKAKILDFGCGVGRDTKYFLEKGNEVDATDGSPEMCRIASEYTGVPVKQMYFEELSAIEEYDGIWACSSILHLPKNELTDVMRKMISALKPSGTIYTSFKYGIFEGERGERYFTDFTEETLAQYLKQFTELELKEYWVTADIRPGREDEKWLNVILNKG